MGRPREHTDATRLRLLSEAERLVARHGPAGVSVRSVADAAGTSTRAVYSLFGSMPGLLEALAVRLFQELGAAVDAVAPSDDPAADVVRASVDGFRRVACEHPALYGLVFLRVIPDLALGPEFGRAATAAFARLEHLLARVQAAQGLGGHTVTQAAQAVHALTEGLASIELRGELGPPDAALPVWRTAIAALVRGFGRPPAAEQESVSSGSGDRAAPSGRPSAPGSG
jgi:AcrR family transcriptional regulator